MKKKQKQVSGGKPDATVPKRNIHILPNTTDVSYRGPPLGRYIWDGDYIADTWLRDVVYMAMGLSALLLTGTFFNLAGMVSPMAVLNQVNSAFSCHRTESWKARWIEDVLDRWREQIYQHSAHV